MGGGCKEEGAGLDNEGEPLSKLARSVFDLFRRVLIRDMEQGEGGGGGGGEGGGAEEEVLHSVLWAFPLGEYEITGFTGTKVRILTHKPLLVAVHLPSHTLESESRYAFSL